MATRLLQRRQRTSTVASYIVRCVAVAIVPMTLVAVYFVATGIIKDIDVARLEQAGDTYQRPLEGLLMGLEAHQNATSNPASNPGLAPAAEEIVRSGLTALDRNQQSLGAKLLVTPKELTVRNRQSFAPAHLQQEWREFQQTWPQLDANKRAAQYNAIEADIRGLIGHIGDESGLILDPDLDSYYLMDATLVALPQTQTRLRQIRSFYRAIDRSKKLDQADRIAAAVFAAQLKEADLDRLNGDFDTCFKEDVNYNGVSPTLLPNLRPASQRYSASNSALLEKIANYSKTEDPARLDAIDKALDSAIQDSYSLESVALNELDHLLDARIQQRYVALARGSVGVLFAILISGFYAFFSLRRLTRNLGEYQHELDKNSRQLLETGNESANRAKRLAQAAEQQSSSLESTAAATHQINSLTQANAQQSTSARHLISKVTSDMETLRTQAQSLSISMTEMTAASSQISGIVSVIGNIALQTNLLALNAAVEAARAGEAGVGFSVVAEEVRNLAQNSAGAAKDITALIESAIKKTRTGETKLREVVMEIEALSSQSRAVAELILAMAKSEEEQVQGIDQIEGAITKMQIITQQTAADADASAQLSSQLWQSAERLDSVVQNIKSLTGAT